MSYLDEAVEAALTLLAVTHFDHERLITDEDFECADLYEQGFLRTAEIGQTSEYEPQLTAKGYDFLRAALKASTEEEGRDGLHPNLWRFTVVVSGFPVSVVVSAHEENVAGLMREAFVKAGVKPPDKKQWIDIAYWELRKEDGELVTSTASANDGNETVSRRITESGLHDGEELFLHPEPGAGA